jgi:hypothetical protein
LRLPRRYEFFYYNSVLIFTIPVFGNSDIDLVIETVDEVSATDGLVQLADLVREEAWAEDVDEVLQLMRGFLLSKFLQRRSLVCLLLVLMQVIQSQWGSFFFFGPRVVEF